ncbi:uncharacterized protein LOC115376982 [Myripristis murdjan]|uniref:uncharacterized protein LOC115376982 n=1 Tax=Myripristis murdjan TaxID=586833 RepID=UPI00117638B2|nr:uncharacterized protein LOC115376982 [Myripristis murdjan]
MNLILNSARRRAEGNVFSEFAAWRSLGGAAVVADRKSCIFSVSGTGKIHSSKREKMISSLLLLLVLTSSVCGRIVVNVSQTFYQAVENSSIMMEWIFMPIIILTNLNVYCSFWLSDHRTAKTLYHLQGGVEHPESQDQQFVGRARWDREDLGKGLVRLHLSRLRINDSGIYRCEVFTEDNDDDGGFSECLLNVTAADRHLAEAPEEKGDGGFVNHVPAAAAVPVIAVAVVAFVALPLVALKSLAASACHPKEKQDRHHHGDDLESVPNSDRNQETVSSRAALCVNQCQMSNDIHKQKCNVFMSFHREKMFSSILLLLVLTPSVCETLVMSVSQISYQAEENSSITMEWTFTPIIPLTNLIVYCWFWLPDRRTSKTLYHLQGGVEHPESQDEQFAGRARWDREDLGKGLVRLHLSRLRINDSGIYRCEVFTEGDGGFSEFFLNITAADCHLAEAPEEKGDEDFVKRVGTIRKMTWRAFLAQTAISKEKLCHPKLLLSKCQHTELLLMDG